MAVPARGGTVRYGVPSAVAVPPPPVPGAPLAYVPGRVQAPASMLVHWSQGEPAGRELFVALFLFIAAPVSANLLALAALHLAVSSAAPPPDDINRH